MGVAMLLAVFGVQLYPLLKSTYEPSSIRCTAPVDGGMQPGSRRSCPLLGDMAALGQKPSTPNQIERFAGFRGGT